MINKDKGHPSSWPPQELINYILEEGILTTDQLMSLAPTDEQLLTLVLLDELDKE